MSAFFALLTVLLFAAVMGLPYERQDIEDSVQRLIKLYRDRHHSPLHKRNELPSKARYYNHSANIRAPNKYIIKLFKDTTVSEMDEFKLFISQLGWTIVYQMDADFPCFVVQTADGEQKVPMDLLERLPQIDIVEEDHKMVRLSVQKQPLDSSQWALDQMDNKAFPNDQNSYAFNLTGKGVNVYVIDTDVDVTHKQFGGRAERVYQVKQFTPKANCPSHGTHVAGIVAGENTGMAKLANIKSVQVIQCDEADASDVIMGIDWVRVNHVKPAVINFSIGGDGEDNENSPTLEKAIKAAIKAGITFVSAAGNYGKDTCHMAPAGTEGVIAVGATDKENKMAKFSNYGPCISLFAPGKDVNSLAPNNGFEYKSGTSQAAPFVAGIAALYLQQNSNASPAQVKKALQDAAVVGKITGLGKGSPNYFAQAVFALPSPPPTTPSANSDPSIPPNDTNSNKDAKKSTQTPENKNNSTLTTTTDPPENNNNNSNAPSTNTNNTQSQEEFKLVDLAPPSEVRPVNKPNQGVSNSVLFRNDSESNGASSRYAMEIGCSIGAAVLVAGIAALLIRNHKRKQLKNKAFDLFNGGGNSQDVNRTSVAVSDCTINSQARPPSLIISPTKFRSSVVIAETSDLEVLTPLTSISFDWMFEQQKELQPNPTDETMLKPDCAWTGTPIPHCLSTKYYTADILLCPIPHTDGELTSHLSQIDGNEVDAIIFATSTAVPSSIPSQLLEFQQLHQPSIAIACVTGVSDKFDDKDLEFCIENGFELVDLNASAEEAEENERLGIDRVWEILESHVWDGMVRVGNDDYNSTLTNITESNDVVCNGNENDDEDLLDEFSETLQLCKQLRAKSSLLSDDERRQRAEDILSRFLPID